MLNAMHKNESFGQPWWRSGLAPPAAQGMILETLDRVPHRALCMMPASPSACVSASLSLYVSPYLKDHPGQPWWRSGLAPPAAQGVILETRDRVPHRAPCMEPASPSLSLCLS